MYTMKYASPTSEVLADRVQELLKKSNINCLKDEKRGYDHGCWMPLKVSNGWIICNSTLTRAINVYHLEL